MSKKKGKATGKKTPKMKAVKRTGVRTASTLEAANGGRTVGATIFIYRTSTGNRIRTSPQRLYANPGDRVEWSVVNLVDGSDVPVTITWPESGPWGKDPIQFRSMDRRTVNGATQGRFKYVVSALDASEDPEVEIPDV